MNATSGARRITSEAVSSARASVSERAQRVEPVLGSTFVSVCAAVLLGALLMSAILAMGSARPVPGYAIFGSAFFGIVFSSFLVGALHLAVTDSRRHKDDDH